MQFSEYKFHTFCCNLFPFFEIVLYTILNGVVFLISFFVCLCQCIEIQLIILILCLVTLMNSIIISNKCLYWIPQNLFFIQYLVIYKKRQFYFFLTYLDAFYLFYLYFQFRLISLTRTSSTMLNRIVDETYLCLIPDLRQKSFNRSPLSILALGLSQIPFFSLRSFFHSQFVD